MYSNSAVNSIAQKPSTLPSSQHMWEGASAPVLQLFSPFTSRIHLIVCLPSMFYT